MISVVFLSVSVYFALIFGAIFFHPADIWPIRDFLKSVYLRHSILSLVFAKHVSSLII